MYVGETRTITQGVEGQEEVNATITYVNGQETERTVNSTTTLQEPTTTVKAVGTKEKPRTASSGSYQWPIYGRITSYFGGRYIFGSYSYHSGIDISASLRGGGVCRRRRNGDLRRLPGQLWQPGGHHPRQRDPDLLRP